MEEEEGNPFSLVARLCSWAPATLLDSKMSTRCTLLTHSSTSLLAPRSIAPLLQRTELLLAAPLLPFAACSPASHYSGALAHLTSTSCASSSLLQLSSPAVSSSLLPPLPSLSLADPVLLLGQSSPALSPPPNSSSPLLPLPLPLPHLSPSPPQPGIPPPPTTSAPALKRPQSSPLGMPLTRKRVIGLRRRVRI